MIFDKHTNDIYVCAINAIFTTRVEPLGDLLALQEAFPDKCSLKVP
jgi:hypothetical protein